LDNSLAAHPTSRPVLRGGGGSNAASLPGVLNSPIIFIDPSGHDVDCFSLDTRCRKVVIFEKKLEADTTKITKSGQKVLDIYYELLRRTGNEFTFEDLIRLIYEREIDGWHGLPGIAEKLAEASVRNYWLWATVHSIKTLINWLGAYNQAAKDTLYNLVFNSNNSLNQIIGNKRTYIYNAEEATIVQQALLDPPGNWKVPDPDAPYGYGVCDINYCILGKEIVSAYTSISDTTRNPDGTYNFNISPDNIYFKTGVSYIITKSQLDWWTQ
jgi:hypothetical protein